MTTMAAWIADCATRDGVIVPCVIEGALDEIGIPPDMDVGALRRRLLWGERVEQWRDKCMAVDGWDYTLDWLTRPAEGDDE